MKRYNRLIIAFAILLSGLALIPQVGLFAEAVSWQRYVGIYELTGISGTVTAAIGGDPLANINVTAYRDDGPGFGTATTNASGNYTLTELPAGSYRLYFRDPASSYLSEWYNNSNSWNEATLVTVNAEATTEGIDISLITPNQPEPPQATVEPESGSVWTDPHTGEVTVGLYGRVDVTISRNVSCADGSSPTSVTLLLGDTAYSMSETPAGSGTYSVAISGENLPDNIPWNGLPLTVRAECDGSNEETDIGTLFIDPSGFVTDADTSAPISGATVTLYKDPNRTPDNSGPVDLGTECPTINTRPNNDWFSGDLPSATVDQNQEADPNSGEFIPATNPLATDATGFYRWDVIEGCWYVVVEADGYQTKVSPIVGVVAGAEVTDLNFQLSSTSQLIYLPIIQR